MLGDAPDETMFIRLANPWTRDCKYFDNWLDPAFKKIHVDWKLALKEGRTTQAFIDEQRKNLTPLEFKVLYDSEFPDEEEDSIFDLKNIQLAIKTKYVFTEEDIIEWIISCDVADMGNDECVIYWGYKLKNGTYKPIGHWSHPKTENMRVAGQIVRLIKEFITRKNKGITNIDSIGIGTGVVSRVKEWVEENKYENVKVVKCHYGEKPASQNQERYVNKKAEQFFRLRSLFKDQMLDIYDFGKIQRQLMAMKWELNSSGKIKIIDPDKSPDWADALVYFTWKDLGPTGDMFILDDPDNTLGLK